MAVVSVVAENWPQLLMTHHVPGSIEGICLAQVLLQGYRFAAILGIAHCGLDRWLYRAPDLSLCTMALQ